MTYDRVIPIFAAAFALVYVVSVEQNWALFTYHPRTGEFDWLTQPARNGPAMHWFGWIGTSVLAATAIALAAMPLTKRWAPPLWIGWAIPLAVMVTFLYLLRSFFLR